MLVPNRNGLASPNGYRYGFQGQEKDDEIKGKGNSINYTFRMHDPRIGRFFAVDPLTSKYPWYTPYQFSGNKVIQFVELEGLEEGMIFGSDKQIAKVNAFNQNVPKDKQNWTASKFDNLGQVIIEIEKHKALGNKVRTVLLQAHAGSGQFTMFHDTDARALVEANYADRKLSTGDISIYITELNRINLIQSPAEKEEEMGYFNDRKSKKVIEDFLALCNQIEDGGTLILNGCHVFDGSDGKEFSNEIRTLTNNRINIIGAQDFINGVVPENSKIFGGGLTDSIYETNGYSVNSSSTGQDLQLNGTTDKPPFQFIPFIMQNTNEKK